MATESEKTAHLFFRRIAVFLLVILLLLAGILFAIITDRLSIDDPAALSVQTPMAASQRFTFDAANETAQIRLDKSDLWWLLLPEMEDGVFEEVNRKLEQYDLSITGYGFDIREEGICLDLETMYQSVRIPVHILTSLDVDASGFSVRLSKAKLGPFRLPAATLLGFQDVRMDVDWPVITDITDVAYRQDTVLLTGTLTQDMLSCVQQACQADAVGWFSTNHQAVFRVARDPEGFRELLPGLEQDPGSIEALYHDMFTLAQVDEYEAFMHVTKNLSHRFFPGIDFTAMETESDAVRAQWVLCDVMIDKLVTQAAMDFNARRFRLKDGAFYLQKNEFDALNYFSGDTALKIQQLFHVIDLNKFHLVLVDASDGYSMNSPVLSRVCAKNQQLTQELSRNKAYPIGCVFQGVNGEYCLRYECTELSKIDDRTFKVLKTVILSETEYASLIQDGKIGVWVS